MELREAVLEAISGASFQRGRYNKEAADAVMAVLEDYTERVKVTAIGMVEPHGGMIVSSSAVIVVEGDAGVLMNCYVAYENSQSVDLTMLSGSGSWI